MADYNSTNTGAVIDASVDAVEFAKAAIATDTTAGRLLKVGDFGLGASSLPALITDLNNVTISQIARFDSGALNRPTFSFGTLLSVVRSPNEQTQFAISTNEPRGAIRYKVSGVWSDWQELATQGNNALIEFGSNSNGSFTKFPDGTLICNHGLVGSGSSEVRWTFPASFISTPRGQLTATSTGAFSLSARYSVASESFFDFSVFNSANARSSTSVAVTAIGRWK